MRKKILPVFEYHYQTNYERYRYSEQWIEYLEQTPLQQIENACQKEGTIFNKHLKIPRDKKKAKNGKFYTIIPRKLMGDLKKKWDEINSNNPERLRARLFIQTAIIECTGAYIDTLALPIVWTYYHRKRCPITQCHKKDELKGKDCYLKATRVETGHVDFLINEKGHRIPYVIDMRVCPSTHEPYLIEYIPRILVIEITKSPTDKFPEDLICPYCTCNKKGNFGPIDDKSVKPFSRFNFELLGEKVYLGKTCMCFQCNQTFETFLIPTSSFDILESKQDLLKKGKFDSFKEIINKSNNDEKKGGHF